MARFTCRCVWCAETSFRRGSGCLGQPRWRHAHPHAFREGEGNLRVTLSQLEELEEFVRFGTRLDDATRARLAWIWRRQ
ncbi:MAG: hypothetical protein WAT09_15925 [Paracoccaceae bacterium]